MGMEARPDKDARIKSDSNIGLAVTHFVFQEGGDETTTVSHQEKFD